MKYSTVLFDSDMTLLNFDEDERIALYRALESNSVECTPEIHSVYREINASFWKKYERGEVTKSEIGPGRFAALLSFMGVGLNPDKVNRDYMSNLSNTGNLLSGADDLCASLCKKGYSLYIITNGTDFIQKKRFKNSGITKYMKDVFISDIIGFQKPRKEFFDCVLNKITEKDKSKILIVGDSLTSDILGGINSSIDTCLYAPDGVPGDAGIQPTYTVKNYPELEQLLDTL